MKFVAFFEHTREETDKLTPKSQKWAEALRKGPEKHIKRIFPPHYFAAVNEKGTRTASAYSRPITKRS